MASPPCTDFSHAKPSNNSPGHRPDLTIIHACEKLAAQAHAPLILENVLGAQRYLGPPAHHFGKFYLWGKDVPALLPQGPHWKQKYKTYHRDPMLRARIPEELATAIGRHFLTTRDRPPQK